MNNVLVVMIRGYQRILSPDKGVLRFFLPNNTSGHCNMHPTCSEYAIISITKYGTIRGVARGALRILRCHPFQKNLIDEP